MTRKKTLRLLLVDDSALVRRGLANLLRGIESLEIVGEAADVRSGVETAERLRPDVIVLDFNMPDGNGLDVLARVKAQQQPPIVIMFTSHSSQQLRDKCLEAGADHFFQKGTEFRQLVELLRTMSGQPHTSPPNDRRKKKELVSL